MDASQLGAWLACSAVPKSRLCVSSCVPAAAAPLACRLVQFAKEVKLLFPNAQRVNRGSMVRRTWAVWGLLRGARAALRCCRTGWGSCSQGAVLMMAHRTCRRCSTVV